MDQILKKSLEKIGIEITDRQNMRRLWKNIM